MLQLIEISTRGRIYEGAKFVALCSNETFKILKEKQEGKHLGKKVYAPYFIWVNKQSPDTFGDITTHEELGPYDVPSKITLKTYMCLNEILMEKNKVFNKNKHKRECQTIE